MKIDNSFGKLQHIIDLQSEAEDAFRERKEHFSWLNTGHPLGPPPKKIDTPLLAKLAGDKFYNDSAVGGDEFSACLDYFSAFIEQILKNPILISKETLPKLEKLQELMREGSKISAELEEVIQEGIPEPKSGRKAGNSYGLSRFCDKLLKKLQKEKELWLPISWADRKEHPQAILVHVQLPGTVTVFNTNQDVDGQGRFIIETLEGKDEVRFQQFITFHNVNPERLEHKTFFRVLCELACRPQWNQDFYVSESFIIEPLEEYLQGKKKTIRDFNDEPEMFKKPVRSNFPITKTITSAIFYVLGDAQEYKKLKFLWQTQALVAYEGDYNEFVREVVENLSRSTLKISLDPNHLKTFQTTAEDILSRITQGHEAPSELLEPLTADKISHDILAHFTLQFHMKRPKVDSDYSHVLYRAQVIEKLRKRYQALPPWPSSPEDGQVLKALKGLQEITESYRFDEESLNNLAFDQFAECILGLPEPCRTANSYWEGVPQEFVVPCMNTIYSLMKHAIELSEDSYRLKNAIILYKLFAINCVLGQACSESSLKGHQYNPEGLKEYAVREIHVIKEPKYQQQLTRVLEYFYPGYNITKRYTYISGGLFQIERSYLGLEYHFYEDSGKEKEPTFLLMSHFLDQILADPAKKKRLYERSSYHLYNKGTTLEPLKEEDSYRHHLMCLMAEPVDEDSLLPHSVHLLLHSTILVMVHQNYKKELLNHHKQYLKLQARCEVRYNETKSKEVFLLHSNKKEFWRREDHCRSNKLRDAWWFDGVNGLIHKEITVLNQTLDISREALMMGIDPYDEVARAFAFIKKQPNLLKNEDVQEAIESHLFRYGRLLSQLYDNSEVIAEGAEILKKLIAHYIHLNDSETSIFLTRLGLQLSHFASAMNIQEPLPDFRRIMLEEVVPRFSTDPRILASCYKAILTVYTCMKPEQLHEKILDVVHDLYSYLLYQQISCEKKALEAEQLYYLLLPNISHLLNHDAEARHVILNAFVEKFLPTFETQKWKGTFPLFESDIYQADMHNIKIKSVDGDLFTTLPPEVMKDDLFRKIFKGKILTCTSNESDHILTLNKGLEDELEVDTEKLEFFRKINGLECQYIATPGIYHWNRIQNPTTECWIRPVRERNYVVHILENGTREICHAHVKQSQKNPSSFQHKSMERGSDKVQRLVLSPPIPDVIQRMEDCKMSQMEYWTDTDGKLKELRLQTSRLAFYGREVEGQTRLFSKEYPGFYLVKNIDVPSSMKKYLTLQNHSGDCKVLYYAGHVIEYDVVEGDLCSKQLLGQLTLLYLLLEAEEYTTAINQLKQILPLQNIGDHRYCSSVIGSINVLLRKREKQPMANAIFLHFIVLIEKNTLKYPKSKMDLGNDDEDFVKRVAKRYVDVYCQNRYNLVGFLLSYEEEQMLVEYLISNGQHFLLRDRVSLFRTQKPNFGRRLLLPVQHNHEEPATLDCKKLIAASWKFRCAKCDEKLIKKEDYFLKHFFRLYKHAKESKEKLIRLLDLNCIHAHSPYYRCLRMVADAPENFPKDVNEKNLRSVIPLLEKRLNSKGWLQNKIERFIAHKEKKVIPGWVLFDHRLPERKAIRQISFPDVPLSDLDEAYNAYFQGLFKSFFASSEVKLVNASEEIPTSHSDANVRKKLREENAELRYYRQHQPDTETKYSLCEGKKLSQLKENLEVQIKRLSQRLKTAKVALLWFINKGSFATLYWQDVKRLTLTAQTEETFHHSVAEYLVHSTRLNQMKSLVKIIQQVENYDERFLPEVVNALLHKRAYTASSSSFDRLWFEEANGFLYRNNQLAKLEEISSSGKKEVLGEMPTGFGKSKALIPTLNHRKRVEGLLIFNTWPASLEMTNTYDIRELMSQSFAMQVDRIFFNRSTPISTRTLAHLYQDLLRNLKTGQPVNIKSESLRALELHTILYLNEPNDREDELTLMLKILRLIRTRGWSTIDESHLTLDPKDKLIYTLGNPSLIPMEHVLLIQDFCDFLTEGKLNAIIKIRKNLQATLPRSVLENDVVPQIVEYFVNRFETKDPSFRDFLVGQDQTIPRWIAQSPQKSLLALAKGLLTQLLEISLKGSVDENYGLSKLHIGEIEFAIPYVMANTPKETKDNPTQYKNPHETLLKTYFTYLYKGLSLAQVKKLISSLKDQAFEQSIDGFSLSETEASLFFQSLVGKEGYYLCSLTEKEIEEVAAIISKSKETIYYYIQMYVIPQLKTYSQTIISTVHNFRSQFAGCLSFSATPQDRQAHSIDTHFVPMKGTSGQVTHLLLTKCKDPKTLHPLYSKTPEATLEESFEIAKGNPRLHATIDIGANFKGLSNQEVAVRILLHAEKNEEIQAVLYFDDTDGLFKVVDKTTGILHLLTNSHIDPSHVYSYYDQSRCYGSDIKQAIDAAALLMTNENTTKSGAGQAAGRMRQWHQQQTVEVAYPNEMERDIKKLIVRWIENEVKKEEITNYMSLVQQMDNEVRRSVLDKILNADISDAKKLFNAFKSALITEDTTDPWELYAHLPKQVNTKEYLRDYHKAKNLKLNPDVWEEMILPATIQPKQVGIGMECEVLLELNTSQETEVEEQVESDDNKDRRIKSKWSKQYNLFNTGWENPHSVYLADKVKFVALNKLPKLTEYEETQIGITSVISVVSGVSLMGAALLANNTALKCTMGGAGLLLTYAGIQSTKTIVRYYRFQMEFFTAPNYLQQYLPVAIAAGGNLFSKNLLVSKNLYTVINRKESSYNHYRNVIKPQIPFERDQKPLFSVLVIRDEISRGKPKFTIALIDQNDSKFLHGKLQQDIQSTSEEDGAKRSRKVGLYDLTHNMFTVAGRNKFTYKDIDHPTFWNLIGQAKFLNGQIKFELKEEEHFGAHLDRKIPKIGFQTLQTLYVDHILKNRPLYRKCIIGNKVPRWITQKLHLNKI